MAWIKQTSKSLLFRCFRYSDVCYSDPHCTWKWELSTSPLGGGYFLLRQYFLHESASGPSWPFNFWRMFYAAQILPLKCCCSIFNDCLCLDRAYWRGGGRVLIGRYRYFFIVSLVGPLYLSPLLAHSYF